MLMRFAGKLGLLAAAVHGGRLSFSLRAEAPLRKTTQPTLLLSWLQLPKLSVPTGLAPQKWWLSRHAPKALRNASSGQSARIGKNCVSKREGELQIESAIRGGIAVRP